MRATAKAAAQATAKAEEVVMPEELAAQADPTWAIPAPRLPAWATAMAARLLVVYAG
jgi:hypothetical protein